MIEDVVIALVGIDEELARKEEQVDGHGLVMTTISYGEVRSLRRKVQDAAAQADREDTWRRMAYGYVQRVREEMEEQMREAQMTGEVDAATADGWIATLGRIAAVIDPRLPKTEGKR